MTAPRDPMIRGAAAAAIDRGWSVFPVRGKIPATEHGVLDASRDYDLIETWWPEATDRGIAIATGAPSRVWILDLDGPEAIDRFLDLQSENGKVPPTITSRTSRGFHLFFEMPETGDVRNSAGKVAAGIDVRGTGGYVVIPPSPHPSGICYSWAKHRSPDELVPILPPAWLLARVQKAPPPASISAPGTRPDPKLPVRQGRDRSRVC